jgi:hypothetical protein
MVIALWVVLIHIIELTIIGAVLLVRRNNALEKAIVQQREFIDAISIIVTNSDEKLRELDINGVFEADDEVGNFFKNLKEIQTIISEFNNSRN